MASETVIEADRVRAGLSRGQAAAIVARHPRHVRRLGRRSPAPTGGTLHLHLVDFTPSRNHLHARSRGGSLPHVRVRRWRVQRPCRSTGCGDTLKVERQVVMMQTFALILRRAALVLTWLFCVGGALFALGYAFEDPGGWTAVLLAAAVVVPLAGLTVLAMRSPHLGLTVLTVAVVLFAAWAAVDLFVDIDMPHIPVIALILAAPLSVVGQRYALRAGGLMFALAAIPFTLVLVRLVQESGIEGPSLGDLLGTSTGAVVVPLAVLAALFVLAGWLGHSAAAPDEPPQVPDEPSDQAAQAPEQRRPVAPL